MGWHIVQQRQNMDQMFYLKILHLIQMASYGTHIIDKPIMTKHYRFLMRLGYIIE